MAEQRKAAGPGDTNAVTHELVKEGEPETSAAAKRTSKSSRVLMRVDYPHTEFDLSAQGLPKLTNDGVYVTREQADNIRVLGMRYGVPVREVADDNEEN